MQAKVFVAGISYLQEKMDEWFLKVGEITIVGMKQSVVVGGTTPTPTIIVTILYKGKSTDFAKRQIAEE